MRVAISLAAVPAIMARTPQFAVFPRYVRHHQNTALRDFRSRRREFRASRGYFRHGYNACEFMRAMGLSWQMLMLIPMLKKTWTFAVPAGALRAITITISCQR